MDFILAILFLLWYEALSLPLRGLLARWPAPPDVRRMLSRVAGPALLALPVWFLAHLPAPSLVGSVLGRGLGFVWIGAALAIGVAAGRRAGWARLLGYEQRTGERGRWSEFAIDAGAAVLFLAFVALRRQIPEMTFEIGASAAEKFGNAMIWWANWHARSLPPEDYWLAGHKLAYYYWGHFHWAWLSRLAGFASGVALNLSMAGLTLLTWEAAYLLARAARLGRAWSALAGLAVAWGGNPAALVAALKWWNAPWGINWGAYDVWGPSRAISGVVDEFPAFSAILGDFHSHHLALPWLTGWLALVLAGRRWVGAGWIKGEFRAPDGRRKRAGDYVTDYDSDREYEHGIRFSGAQNLLGLAVWGILYLGLATAGVLTNLWNLPLVGFAVGLQVLFTFLRRGWKPAAWAVGLGLVLGGVLMVGARLLRAGAPLPLPTSEQAGFLARLPAGVLPPSLRSSLFDLFGLWGFPVLILGVGVLAHAARVAWRDRRGTFGSLWREFQHRWGVFLLSAIGAVSVAVACGAWVHGVPEALRTTVPVGGVYEPLPANAVRTLWHAPWGASLVWSGVAASIVALALGRRPWLPWPLAGLLLAGVAVLAGLELFYIKDRFDGSTYARYNTYFKLSYPIWPILYVGAFVVAQKIWDLGFRISDFSEMRSAERGTRKENRGASSSKKGPVRYDRQGRRLTPGGLSPLALMGLFVLRFIYPVLRFFLGWGLRLALLGLFVLLFVYPVLATPGRVLMARYNDRPARRPSLNAFNFTAHREPWRAEAALLDWIRDNKNVPAGDIVAEAPGVEAYSYNGRVASLAGHPAPLGWMHHEQQWRGPAGYSLIDERRAAVDALYQAPSPELMARRARELGVRWVIYGLPERKQYPGGTLAMLRRTAPLAFQSGGADGGTPIFLFDFRNTQK